MTPNTSVAPLFVPHALEDWHALQVYQRIRRLILIAYPLISLPLKHLRFHSSSKRYSFMYLASYR